MQLKKCTECQSFKSLDDFTLAKLGKFGRAAKCRECAVIMRRNRYYANIEATRKSKREEARRWRQHNLERAREAERKWYREHREYFRKRYQENREKILAHVKQYRIDNPDRWIPSRDKARRKFYEKNRAKIVAHAVKKVQEKRRLGLIDRKAEKRRRMLKYPEKFKMDYATKLRLKEYAEKYPERIALIKANNHAKRRAAPGFVTSKQWKEILLFYGRACAKCKTPEAERPLTVDHFIPIIKGGGDNTASNVWPLCMKCNLAKASKIPTEPFPPHVLAKEQRETA